MRKNNTAIIFGSLFFSCSVMAANGTLAPTVVPMVNGGQASIAISNTSPNLFTVPGDRIIAVNSLDGALTNNEQTASGGVVVATVNKKPFTFILETERGLNLSIQAVPREGAGRTIQLVSDLRGTGEEAGAWETSTPYESLLVTISQAVRGGKLPAGWYQVPVTKETLQAPAGLSSVADAVWTGNHLKMVRFAVENKTLSALNIRESDFWQPGTRAVMFSQQRQAIAKLAEHYGIMFFYRGQDPIDGQLAQVINGFRDTYGLSVIPVSVDGVINPLLPDSRTDQGQAQRLGVKYFPAMMLVDPKQGSIRPLSYGFISQDDLAKQFLNVSEDFKPNF